MRDLYEVLGIERGASPDEIKAAYRRLARQHHPDVNQDDPHAEETFKEIGQAYAVLSDPNKRKEYDTRGFAGVAGFSSEDLFGGINFGLVVLLQLYLKGNHFKRHLFALFYPEENGKEIDKEPR